MRLLILSFLSLILLPLFSSSAQAAHSWGDYHWARTSNPFNLKLGDNVTSAWDPYLSTTSYDWSLSSVLNTAIVSGSANPKNCRASAGTVQVCNAKYGNNGWLGIAQIWASGNHITQGSVKMNDSYFSRAQYNTAVWKNLVMCQEVGHALGLDHQDEDFGNPNLNTCMDYSNDPVSNQHPNTHDYEQLEAIYSHLDINTTLSPVSLGSANGEFHNRSDWGKEIRNNGNVAVYMREFGPLNKVFTFVVWASEE